MYFLTSVVRKIRAAFSHPQAPPKIFRHRHNRHTAKKRQLPRDIWRECIDKFRKNPTGGFSQMAYLYEANHPIWDEYDKFWRLHNTWGYDIGFSNGNPCWNIFVKERLEYMLVCQENSNCTHENDPIWKICLGFCGCFSGMKEFLLRGMEEPVTMSVPAPLTIKLDDTLSWRVV